jgi:hypothetical protein
MESLIDVEHTLHPIIARRNVVQAYRGISEDRTIKGHGRAGRQCFYVQAENLLRFGGVVAEQEARLFFVASGAELIPLGKETSKRMPEDFAAAYLALFAPTAAQERKIRESRTMFFGMEIMEWQTSYSSDP